MENDDTLTTRAEEHLSVFYQRVYRPSKGLHFILVLSFILFLPATCGLCATRNHVVPQIDGRRDPYDTCRPYIDDYDMCLRDFLVGDINSNYVQGNSPPCSGLKTVCTNSEFLCFPSTLPDFWAEEDNCKAAFLDILEIQDDATLPEASILHDTLESNSSWFSDRGKFMLLNGRIVLCSLNSGKGLHDKAYAQSNDVARNDHASRGGPPVKQQRPSSISNKNPEVINLDHLDSSSSPHVEITPSSLDWGQNYLYFPSVAFLTVTNTCNDSILHIYEPFSTDAQFYPCDFDEAILGPGEVASICFCFLPQWLGLSSAHLILQTSFGGFLIHAKGLAIEFPYQIPPLVGLDISSEERWSKNLSLHNPFDDTLFVEEVTAWISFSSGNTSHSAEAVCKMDTYEGSNAFSSLPNVKEWLEIKSSQVGFPLVAIRPHRSWEINPHHTEPIIEIDFFSGIEGKVFGDLRMQLSSSSQDRTDMIIVPLEAEVHGRVAYSAHSGQVPVSLESLIPCDGSETIAVALFLTNGTPYLLSVAKINEVTGSTKLFNIKYMDGLLLFPGTISQIAVVTYTQADGDSHDPPAKIPDIHSDCKLLIATNDSGSPQIEIPCQDVVNACSRHQPASYVGYKRQPEKSESDNAIAGSFGSVIQSPSQNKLKALEIAETDELVLRNWRSQGTTSGMSVLEDDEILFPMVQIGSHCSKWITVKNPSQQPVIMQLILNSGVIIDQCRAAEEVLPYPLSCNLVHNEFTPTRYGFSIAEAARTEVHVHPYDRAFFGPIVFHPSDRCGWRGSVLIRNNLSGIEWLPLRRFGGSLSLVVLEGSEPVQSLEFNLNMPIPLNVSPSKALFHMEDTSAACSQPLSKELYAKNTGDLPPEVRRIEVSGTDCGLDGSMIHTCKGFALEPGKSTRLLISFQTDFSAAVIHRDLELALATGILVIPMKATLPIYVLGLCRKSFFWMLLKKLSLVIFTAASVTFLVFCCILPQMMALGSQDHLFKTENATISRAGKPSLVHDSQSNSKFSMCNNMGRMLRSIRENETSKLGFVGRYSDCPTGVQDQGIASQRTKKMQDDQGKVVGISNSQYKTPFLPFSSEVKSVALVEPSGSLEALNSGNLTVRIGKERGRRRRKSRASGAGAGLIKFIEVSSSQSGNSTPTSPLSPVVSFTTKQTWPLSPDVDHAAKATNSFFRMADPNHEKEQVFEAVTKQRSLEPKISAKYDSSSLSVSAQPQPPLPRKTTSKPVLLPSATFPCTGPHVPGEVSSSPFLASSSAIPPHARAPGSKLCEEKTIKVEEKASLGKEFTYDIWGSHFSGFHLLGKTKEVSTMISNASGDSQSFFLWGPQTLMQKSQARFISPAPKLPHCAVHSMKALMHREDNHLGDAELSPGKAHGPSLNCALENQQSQHSSILAAGT